MSKFAIITASVVGTLIVAGGGAAVALLATNNASTPLATAALGGKGSGASGGPWPGNDYPSNLANAKQDSIVDPFGEDNRECVSYVAETLSIAFGYHLPFYGGNAVDWLKKATSAHVPSGTTPTVYSVAYSAAHDHVALVVAVTGSGSGTLVTVEQYNAHFNGTYSWDVEPASDFDHYIYFLSQSRPGEPTTPTTMATSITSPTSLSVSPGPSNSLGNDSANPQRGVANPQPASGNPQGQTVNPQPSGGTVQGASGIGGGSATTTTTTSAPPTTNPPPPAPTTYSETTGGVAHTWTDYSNAGGTEGPSIASNQTVQIACKIAGFAVADGNTWWYRIAQSPWNSQYYVSADAFYNDGATSGSLLGTPFVDPAVPNC